MKILSITFQHELDSGTAFVDLDCESRAVTVDIVKGDDIRQTSGTLENCIIFHNNNATDAERVELNRAMTEAIRHHRIEFS